MKTAILVIAVLAAAIVGVLADWLLTAFLPTKPKSKHVLAGLSACIILAIVAIFPSLTENPPQNNVTPTQETVLPTQITNIDTPLPQPAVTLTFKPVINNGLSPDAQITRISSPEDSYLYMLDANSGKIIGAYKTLDGNDFNVDENFNCQPGTYGGYQVGPLVDLLALPKVNVFGAAVLGIDRAGNLIYCKPGLVARALPLPSLPNTNWSNVTALAFDNSNLYVLDAVSRAVWVFVGNDGIFIDTPYFYFNNEIPSDIDTAIDLAVNGDDIYLLHKDGHLSICSFSRLAAVPTRCNRSFYIETRPGKDSNTLNSIRFSQVSVGTAPFYYLTLFQPYTHSIYIFTLPSLQLAYVIEQQDEAMQELASTFTLGPGNIVYFAIGSQIYSADLSEK